LHLCHVDHGWRPAAAAREAEICVTLAERANAGWSVIHLPAPAKQREEDARRLRHAVLLRVARMVGAQAVALGHQADDQAETVLLQLTRGTASAAGMTPWRPPLWRPLLSLGRSELRQYCLDRGLPFADDATNLSAEYSRNRMRHDVLPLLVRENPQAVAALGRFAALRGEEERWLESEAAAIAAELLRLPGAIDLRPLRHHPPPLQRRVLRGLLAEHGLELGSARLAEVQRALQSRQAISPGAGLRLERGLLTWPVADLPWSLLPTGGRVHWGALVLGVGAAPPGTIATEVGDGRLMVRPRLPGDRLHFAFGTRKLQDILVDARVPRPARSRLPVVCLNGWPVWLPGGPRAVDAGTGRTVWAGSPEVVKQLWSVLE
jgi:tRNA(Ile)-lysidine synthase